MNRFYWTNDVLKKLPTLFNENHEVRFRILRMPDQPGDCTMGRLSVTAAPNGGRTVAAIHFNDKIKEHIMTWETPTAINFRYGFEITLYIANR